MGYNFNKSQKSIKIGKKDGLESNNFYLEIMNRNLSANFADGLLAYAPGNYGVITVYVMNRLSAPESTAGCPVNTLVYGKMCEDARFAVPNAAIQDVVLVNPASSITPEDTTILMNNPFSYAPDTLGMYFGESIASIRAMLQRFSSHANFIPKYFDSETGEMYILITVPPMGIHSGPVSTANPGFNNVNFEPQKTGTGAAERFYNLVYTTPLQYWSAGFIGWRGSIRWKIINMLDYSTGSLSCAGWETEIDTSIDCNMQYISDAQETDIVHSHLVYLLATGAQLEQHEHNACCEVEIPFYTNNKYRLCKTRSEWSVCSRLKYVACGYPSNAKHRGIMFLNAAGDDFSLLGYVGPPRMWIDVGVPERTPGGPA